MNIAKQDAIEHRLAGRKTGMLAVMRDKFSSFRRLHGRVALFSLHGRELAQAEPSVTKGMFEGAALQPYSSNADEHALDEVGGQGSRSIGRVRSFKWRK